MLALLQRLHSVLTNDPGLTAIVAPANIGATVRQPAASPSIEYDISSQTRDPSGHLLTSLLFYIHSQQGAAECWSAEEKLRPLMDAALLSDLPNGFMVARVRLTDAARTARSEWAASLRLEYLLHVKERVSQPHQPQ